MYRTALRGAEAAPRAMGLATMLDAAGPGHDVPAGGNCAAVANTRRFVGFAKLFVDNAELLGALAQGGAGSIAGLAKQLGKDPGNLGRTLHKLEAYGIVRLETGPDGAKRPVLAGDRLELTLDLTSGRILLG